VGRVAISVALLRFRFEWGFVGLVTRTDFRGGFRVQASLVPRRYTAPGEFGHFGERDFFFLISLI